MYGAVIFDMDGVLVDTEPMHFASTNELLAEHGVGLTPAEYEGYIGMAEQAFFEELVRRFRLEVPPERLVHQRLVKSLERLAGDPLPPTPGALECVLRLRAHGLAVALASSARREQVELVVDRLGLRSSLTARVSVDDVRAGKPAPDLFLEAARQLGLSPGDCLVVEDAALGVEAARRAGMAVVALVPAGRKDTAHRQAGALGCLHTLEALTIELIEHWAAGGNPVENGPRGGPGTRDGRPPAI